MSLKSAGKLRKSLSLEALLNEAVITEDKDVAGSLNSYSASILETLNIPSEVIEDYERSPDPVIDVINKYASHQNIKKIRDVYGVNDKLENAILGLVFANTVF